jgi:hypothetical protein
MTKAVFRVLFANGQVSFSDSLESARKTIVRRADHDPPAPDILPAEVWRHSEDGEERLVERYPPV